MFLFSSIGISHPFLLVSRLVPQVQEIWILAAASHAVLFSMVKSPLPK